MIVTEVLERNAVLYPDETALVEINPEARQRGVEGWREYDLVESGRGARYRREITWRAFDDRANRLANFLCARGLKKGGRVAILLMNCAEWLPIYFGVLKSGAAVVPLNFRYAADEIQYCLELAEADALIFGPEFAERVTRVRGALPRVKTWLFVGEDGPDYALRYADAVARASARRPLLTVGDGDDAAIYFSSGTTGFPKAILHAHKSLMSACYTENAHHGQTHGDVFLCIPPLYHTGASMHWLGSFLVGGRCVLLRGVKPQWILETAGCERASVVFLLVPWAQDILDAIERGDVDLSKLDLTSWRLMHIGAQPVPRSLVMRWHKQFPNQQYDTNYGLSESMGPGCVHLGVENIEKAGAIGKPGFGWEAEILDETGRAAAQGEIGELAVRGPGVMTCYWRDPEATASALRDGWLLTGDMAQRDAEGFIYLVDRKKDVIITGGENLYPVQIEDFLRAHAAIKDVAVIGLPDPRLGEIAAAIIAVKTGHTLGEADVRAFCEGLPRYKRPKKIIFADVPRNPTGKIEKPKLRRQYSAEHLVELQTR